MGEVLEEEYGAGSLSLNFVETGDEDSSLLHGATQVCPPLLLYLAFNTVLLYETPNIEVIVEH